MDSYTIYCEWCRDHHIPAPTREWWDKACAQRLMPTFTTSINPADPDITTEQREGWAYDNH